MPPPPKLTKSQAHYKFLYLEYFRGGQFKLYRVWDLVKFREGANKKKPCTKFLKSEKKKKKNGK